MQNKPLDLYPPDKTKSLLETHIMPDDLKLTRFQAQPISWDNLVTFCSGTLKFLQENKLQSAYSLVGPSFESIFAEFRKFYQESSDDAELLKKKITLINIEQDIHMITEISATQDISFYLKMIEDLCFDDDLLPEILFLLYWKYDLPVVGYTKLYLQLLSFLTPLWEYLSYRKFHISKFDEESLFDEGFIQQSLKNLQALWKRRGIEQEINFEQVNQLDYTLEFIEKAKGLIVQAKRERDNQYYYELGICSVIYHLCKSTKKGPVTMLNLCITTISYHEKIKALGFAYTESVLKVIREFNNFTIIWADLVEEICFILSTKDQDKTYKNEWMSVLKNTLIMILRHNLKLTLSALSKRRSKLILFEIFEVFEDNKDDILNEENAQERNSLMNNDQRSFYTFVVLINQLLATSDTLNELEHKTLLYNKVQSLIQTRRLNLLITDKCYAILRFLANAVPEIGDKVMASWNLSDVRLLHIISDSSNETLDYQENLKANLKYAAIFVINRINEEKFQEQDRTNLVAVYKAFITKVSEESIKTSFSLHNLKTIGIFLLTLVNTDIPELEDIKGPFVSALINLLADKCSLDRWESYACQQSIWDLIQTQAQKELPMSDKAIASILTDFEEVTSRFQFRSKPFSQAKSESPCEDQIWSQIYYKVNASVAEVIDKLEALYSKINWQNADSPEYKQDLLDLTFSYRRFIYFAVPWLDAFVKVACNSKDDKAIERLEDIFNKICLLHFHPVLNLFAENIETADLQSVFQKVGAGTYDGTSWFMMLSFLDVLSNRLSVLNSQDQPQETLRTCSSNQFSLSPFKKQDETSSKQISAGEINLRTILSGLARLPVVSVQIKPMRDEITTNEKLRNLLQKTLDAVEEFILQVNNTLKPEKSQVDLNLDKKFKQDLGSCLKKLIGIILKGPEVDTAISNFLFRIFIQGLNGSEFAINTFHLGLASDLLANVSPAIKSNVINRLILQQENMLFIMLQEVSRAVKSKLYNIETTEEQKQSLANSLDSIRKIFSWMNNDSYYFTFLGDPSVKYLKECANFEEKEINELLRKRFEKFLQDLEDFEFFAMIALDDISIRQTFNEFIMFAERFYIFIKKNLTDKIKSQQISNSEAQPNLPEQELQELQYQQKKNTKELEDLVKSLSQKFCQIISLFISNYAFLKIPASETDERKTVEEAPKNLLKQIDSFASETINKFKDSTNPFGLFSQTFKLRGWLEILQAFIGKFIGKVIMSKDFLLNLYQASNVLLEQILKETHANIENNNKEYLQNNYTERTVQRIVDMLAQIYLTYFSKALVKDKANENAALISLSAWLELVHKLHVHLHNGSSGFNLLDINRTDFMYWASLVYIVVHSENENADYLVKGDQPLLKLILTQESEKPWAINVSNQLTFALERILRGHLPSETVIETEIKKLVLAALSTTTTGTTSIYTIKTPYQTDYTIPRANIKSLASALVKNTRLIPPTQNGQLNYDEVTSYQITLDPSCEQETPQNKINQVMKEVSSNARLMIDILLDCIVENHLYNSSLLFKAQDKQAGQEKKFKQTWSIVTMLSTLLSTYKEMIAYILFTEKDYYTQISKYLDSNISYLKDVNIESFRSITALDCLWKIEYFTYNSFDVIAWIKILDIPTGITFKTHDDPEKVLDISHLANNWILQCMIKKLQSASLAPLTLFNSVHLMSTVWSNPGATNVFADYFKGGLLTGLNKILYQLKDYTKDYYRIMESYCGIDTCLLAQLKYYYQKQLKKSTLTDAQINQLKKEDYKLFLNDSNDVRKDLKVHKELTGLFEKVKSEKRSTSNINAHAVEKYELTTEEKAFLKERMKVSIKREGHYANLLTIPIHEYQAIIGNSENWQTISNRISTLAQNICRLSEEYPDGYQKILIKNLEAFITGFKQNLNPNMNQSQTNYIQISSSPLSLEFDFIPSYYSGTASSSFHLENYTNFNNMVRDGAKNKPKIPENISNAASQEEESKKNTISTSNTIPAKKVPVKINYFYNESIQSEYEFKYLENQTLVRLKQLNEKVLVAFHCQQLAGCQVPLKDVVIQEVADALKKCSEFEKNLLLCMIGDFTDLKSYEYPNNIEEIREELKWIKSNIQEYLDKVAPNRYDIERQDESRIFQDYELRNILDDKFRFCKEDLSKENVYAPKSLFNQNSQIFKELYIIEESTVEAVLSVFYIEYKIRISAQTRELLEELCRSAELEMKLIDFCLFFLYHPDHLITETSSPDSFPYRRVFNIEESSHSSLVYSVVASNILDFLKNYLPKAPYLVYQSKQFLEEYGLSSLKELKNKLGYMNKISEDNLICDILLGLLQVKDIASDPALVGEVDAIIDNIFSKEQDFELLSIKENIDGLGQRFSVHGLQNCKIVKARHVSYALKSVPRIILYYPKIATKIIEKEIDTLYSQVEKINSSLKAKLPISDTQEILSINTYLTDFEKILDRISSLMSVWILDHNNPDKTPNKEDDHMYKEALNCLNQNILSHITLQDFILHLLELANYLRTPPYNGLPKAQETVVTLLRICTDFYALTCVQSASLHLKSMTHDNESGLPGLSQIMSTEGFTDLNLVPELKSSFSFIRKEKTFDFDILYSDLLRKHSNLLNNIINEPNTALLKKQVILICKKLPYMLQFETKQEKIRSIIYSDRSFFQTSVTRGITIDRNNLIVSVLKEFQEKSFKELKQTLQITFLDEEGYDGGGLKREFYSIVTKELFNPRAGLFQLAQNGVGVQPSQHARIVPNHLKYLRLAGIIMAKAIQDECLLDVTFTKSFLKHILGKRLALTDLEDIDPDFAKSLNWMLKNPVDELEQTFTYEQNILGQTVIKGLIPNGADTLVTDANKKEYFKKICEFKLKEEIKEEIDAFLEGFYLINPRGSLDVFGISELQLLISGISTIDIENMKSNVEYNNGYYGESDIIKWLWEILEEFTQTDLGAFMFFVSGSSRVTSDTFTDQPLKCTRADLDTSSLPIAHTCYHEIEIPEYTSKDELRQKLLLAIYEGAEGFAFG